MLHSLIDSIFGCSHRRTTFPITPSRSPQRSEGARRGTYIVCLDCGKEFDYSWKDMQIGAQPEPVRIHAQQPAAH
jgi:hypothetical protein